MHHPLFPWWERVRVRGNNPNNGELNKFDPPLYKIYFNYNGSVK